ncbi:MAG: hypothetical protein ACP5U1_00675 [Desulfomonilaceae bacterium]
MSGGPDWNWIGYMNSFGDERDNGSGGGCGCLLTLLIIIVSAILLGILGK